MDIYRDYFTREELVRTLAQSPYTPGGIGQLGIYEAVPLASTVFGIEVETKDAGKILTVIPRGSPRSQSGLDKRKVHTFVTQTIGDETQVFADEVLNARGAGTSGAKEILENRRQRGMNKLRRNVDLTHESFRLSTLLAPGTTEFGAQGAEQTIAVQTDTTKMRQEVFNKVVKPIEAALDGESYSGVTVVCSDGFWAEFIENKYIKDHFIGWQQAMDRLKEDVRTPFRFAEIDWIRYRGTSTVKVTDNKAVAVPRGVQGFGFVGFAPNDTAESVGAGALGQPYYVGAKTITDAMGTKGWEMAIASHPKFVIGRPTATFLIKMS
jgi:hypothetical protein